jgi:hypothetical protein
MSYIEKQSTALVRVKLTDVGREQLAKGQLTFNSYVIGDSEVDYDYVKGWSQFLPNPPGGDIPATGEFFFYEADGSINKNIYSKVLRPKDNQPFPSSFLLDQSGNFEFTLNQQSNVQLIKGIVSNKAADRGFFSGSTAIDGLTAVTETTFIKESGVVDLGAFDGTLDTTTYLQGVIDLGIPLSSTTANDYIIFNLSNNTLGDITGNTMTAATVNPVYNVVSVSGSTINVDRPLPILTTYSGTSVNFYVLPGGNNPMDSYYGFESIAPYWNTGTLAFDSSCDICIENIPIWNMNNVWTEDMAGLFNSVTEGNYHDKDFFGSEQYAGTKQILGYNEPITVIQSSNELSNSYIDPTQKAISIIHYSNSCISNYYGEQFSIDEDSGKLLSLDIPVMWHRRTGGTASGTTLGMTFVSDGIEKNLSYNNSIPYYDLIEYSGLSITPTLPLVVGKVFPSLKIVVVENEELLAAMSYKSNRNYTLPDLAGNLLNSVDGNCTGVLNAGEKMFLTYWLENTGTTTTPTLPCQRYTVLENNTTSDKDVEFRINNVSELPYMRKLESVGYDGYGFFADKFNILCQKVPSTQSRPISSQWRKLDFTTTDITGISGETINPVSLENQNSSNTNFILTGNMYNTASGDTFSLGDTLDMSSGLYYDKMTFGDERLFYGNLRTYIGATIYKTLFNINVDGATISSSSNPSYDEGEDRFITEVGILDGQQNLVLVGKLSRPIKISNSSTASIELTIDF